MLADFIGSKGMFDPKTQEQLLARKIESANKGLNPVTLIQRVQKDIKFNSQIASRLVTSVDKMP